MKMKEYFEVNGLTILRYDSETGEPCADGDMTDFASLVHYFEESLEHGLTLKQAIDDLVEADSKV